MSNKKAIIRDWAPTEDSLIKSLKSQPAPPSFAKIAEAVNALPDSPGDRTMVMVKNRWFNRLRHEAEELGEYEMELLKRAHGSVKAEKFWELVSKEYESLAENDEEARVKKVPAVAARKVITGGDGRGKGNKRVREE